MRVLWLATVFAVIAGAAGLSAAAPTAAPGAGSTLAASASPGIDFEVTRTPGQSVGTMSLDLTDPDNPGGAQTVTLNSVSATGPTGVGSPAAPTSGAAGAALTIAWTASVNASNAPGNYDYAVQFQDDEASPNVVNIVVRIIVSDETPVTAAGTGENLGGNGTGGTPYGRNGIAIGAALSQQLSSITDANTGQTLSVVSVSPASIGTISITNNSPGAGAALTLTATSAGLLATDVGTHNFDVTFSDGGTHTAEHVFLRVVIDPPTVTVSSTGSPAEAGTVTGTYTVTCTPAPGTNLTVNFGMTGTAAVASGSDYNLTSAQTLTYAAGPSGTIVIPAAGTATITLTPVDDASAENAETAILTIASGTSYSPGTGGTETATLTIADNDAISVSVGVSANAGTEAATTAITVTLTASQAVPSDTVVTFSVTGTGITGTDYSITGSTSATTETITTGNTTATFTFTVLDDVDIEGAETATITITNVGGGGTIGAPASQNIAITDNDAAPAAGSMAASPSNPGVQSANPGTSRTALVFRVTETGGGTAYTVTGLSATVATVNNTAGVAIARISSVSFVRGSTVLGTVTNGGTGWSAVGDNVTVSLSGLSNNITAGTSADYALAISFTGASVPVPNPRYTASIQTAGVTGSAVLTGTAVTGGQITLIESLPDDPFADDEDEEGCDLSTRGGPAWPAAVAVLLLALLAAVRVARRARN